MTDRIRKGARRVVYLREHRKSKGVSAVRLADRLGIERESYYRLERDPSRLSAGELIELAEALGIEPEQLFRLPDSPSVDAMMANAPKATQEAIVAFVRKLAS